MALRFRRACLCVSSLVLATICIAVFTPGSHLSAQQPAAPSAPAAPAEIPRFELPTSGLDWKAPVHPLKFFDATGHKAGVFGKQTGQYEAWIYPIKVLHGLRLEFRQEGMPEPVRGENYLEYLIARPESTTLVYVHPRFTVKQIIWTPLDEAAIVNFFEVDSDKPLAISVKFIPDFKPMWPASLGGQYSYWIPEEKAFGFTDGTSKPTAIVGSPSVGAFTEHMDHAMVGGEMLLQLRVEPEQARKTLPAIVMALNMESEKKAREIYRRVLSRARELYESRVKYHKDFLARTLTIETPDAELNRAFTWAKVAIDAGWVCHEKMGCGLVAGYGPAGDYERPGFAWWFGGDALMASWAMLDYGDTQGALQVLRFLKARQRDDGKMMHEMTQSVDLVDWFGKYGFAYYHADTTPMYIYSVGEYWRRTGDKKFLEEFWPSVKKAYEWCLTTVDPADGLMDNTKAGLAAVEVGPLRGKVTKDIYLEGFWLAALDSFEKLASNISDKSLADDAQVRFRRAADSLENWWNPDRHYFAFGITADGRRVDRFGAWPAVALALGPRHLLSKESMDGVRALAMPELEVDWGVRWLSNKDELYDPLSYNNGTAWPFIGGMVAWAQFRRGYSLAGYATLASIARLTGAQSPGAMPEHMNGDRSIPGERSVPHQLFSSQAVILAVVRGLLGERNDDRDKLWLLPYLPAHWPSIRFDGLWMEGVRLRGEIRQRSNRIEVSLRGDSKKKIDVNLPPPLPLGARLRRLLVGGKQVKIPATWWYFAMEERLDVVFEFDGGVDIVPIEPKPASGARATALRILNIDYVGEGWNHVEGKSDTYRPPARDMKLEVAGLGGRTYTLDLVTTEPKLTAEGTTVKQTENGYRLEISFAGPENEYVTKQIRLRW